jgi:hypothetical protein
MSIRPDVFRIEIKGSRVLNEGKCPAIGKECNDLVRIIVVFLDLEGFTNFFDSASVNKDIVVASYVNSFLCWVNYRLDREVNSCRLPERPRLSKFLGDGLLYIWEVENQRLVSRRILDLINFFYNLTRGKDCYEAEFLPTFMNKLGQNWSCDYPKHLRASISLGHAVKYVERGHSVDYVSECINIASRLLKINPELYFTVHSDVYIGPEMINQGYAKKKISNIRGISKPIVVYIDEEDFSALSDKSMFQDMR